MSASGKLRSGWDSLTIINGPWHNAGAKIVSQYSYTITNSNGKIMTLVGIDTITNMTVGGGNLFYLINGINSCTSLTTTHVGTASVTFDNGTVRTWHHSRQKVRIYSTPGTPLGGVMTATITGNENIASLTGIEAWGTNRNGEVFYGQIPTATPIMFAYTVGATSSCTYFWPYSGVYVHKGILSGLTVTFGVSAAGTVISPAETCPPDLKLDWTYLGGSKEAIIAY